MSANQLSLSCLREFAPVGSPLFAYRIESSGSPMNDWARHLSLNNLFRRELEENSVLGGNIVVRPVQGDEQPAVERVKILSLAYATRFFGNAEDAKEFIRCVKSIADPQAAQFELEQIASHYYRECRQRNVSEVLKEMAMLGMEMTRVTASVNDLEIEWAETEIGEIKLTPADEKRVREAQKNLPPLPCPTPNFNAEMQAIEKRLSRSAITKANRDEFAAYYLSDEGKSLEELDDDFRRFDALEQFDEDGLLSLRMSEARTRKLFSNSTRKSRRNTCRKMFSRLPNCCSLSLLDMKSADARHNLQGISSLAGKSKTRKTFAPAKPSV